MEKDHKSSWLLRVLAPIVEKIVPPALQKNVREALEKRSESTPEFLQEAAQRAGSLRPEVQPGEPGYTVWATLNVLLPTILAAPLAVNLLIVDCRPWLRRGSVFVCPELFHVRCGNGFMEIRAENQS
jgi:hypothetical protein